MSVLTPLRHERSTETLSGKLRELAASRFDLVRAQADLSVFGHEARVFIPQDALTPTGVIPAGMIEAGMTRTAWRQIAERLRIPLTYLDRLADSDKVELRGLADDNINTLTKADERGCLYRFVCEEEGMTLRAVLSDRFLAIDHEVALRALLEGLGAHDLGLGDCEVDGDITPDRFRLRIHVPALELAVPDLLGDYRMPFSMREDQPMHAPPVDGEEPPVLWAGIEVTNSETGGGAFAVKPRAVVAKCRNGLTQDVEFRRAHIGVALEEGVVRWSAETLEAAHRLIATQVGDAVRTFLSVDYLATVADGMRAAKATPVADVQQAIAHTATQLTLSEVEAASVFDCFARGGDMTVLGIGQAVTAAAQLLDDGDRQAELEGAFWTLVRNPAAFAGAS